MSQENRNTSHDVVRGRIIQQGEGNETGNDHARLAENVRTKPTAPTGYVDAEYNPAFDGSGSERWPEQDDWTKAGQNAEGFPVPKGSAEDVTRPISNLPTQAQADAIAARARAEREARRAA
jgi:hypothetical protein